MCVSVNKAYTYIKELLHLHVESTKNFTSLFCACYWLLNHVSCFQAPYLIYVEVIECDDAHSTPVPCKMMDSSVLRRIHSQEDVALSSTSAASSGDSPAEHQSPRVEPINMNIGIGGSTCIVGCEFDDPDCWSQEEDDIIQVNLDNEASCVVSTSIFFF
jgi:hypothetical protein